MSITSWLKPEDRPGPDLDDTVNHVELIGYVGQDPETRFTARGERVVSLRIATHQLQRDQRGDLLEVTEWHRVVATDALAESAADLRRGALIKVAGRLTTRHWETPRGERRSRTEVVATAVRQIRRGPIVRQVPLPLS